MSVKTKRWPRLTEIHTIAFDFDGVFTDNKVYVIVSTERNPVVAARARKLGLKHRQAVGDKLAFLTAYLRRRHARLRDPFAGLLYVGNDINDLPVIRRAGFSAAPRDAHERVRRAVGAVLPQSGGDGFVRALVEKLLGRSALTSEDIDELVLDR